MFEGVESFLELPVEGKVIHHNDGDFALERYFPEAALGTSEFYCCWSEFHRRLQLLQSSGNRSI